MERERKVYKTRWVGLIMIMRVGRNVKGGRDFIAPIIWWIIEHPGAVAELVCGSGYGTAGRGERGGSRRRIKKSSEDIVCRTDYNIIVSQQNASDWA